MDFDDFLFLSFFSCFFSTFPETPAPHPRILRVTPVCPDTPVVNRCYRSVILNKAFHGFPRSVHAIAGIVAQINTRPLPLISPKLIFTNHVPFDAAAEFLGAPLKSKY
jgi:hypothetical protein